MKHITLTLLMVIISVFGYSQSFDPIKIEIPSVSINGTKLLRKAELIEMVYNQKIKFVKLSFLVSYYSDSLGFYGEEINIKGINPYIKDVLADNKTFVNPLNGDILEKGNDGKYQEPNIGQYDFFYYISQNQKLIVHDLIRKYAFGVKEW